MTPQQSCSSRSRKEIPPRLQQGKAFEALEKSGWLRKIEDAPQFEAQTRWRGKRGRVDIRIVRPDDHMIILVEIKATDWDAMRPERVRPNALRHIRQIWRYIEADLGPSDVVPALVYPAAPRDPARRREIETLMDQHLIQVVWRAEVPAAATLPSQA